MKVMYSMKKHKVRLYQDHETSRKIGVQVYNRGLCVNYCRLWALVDDRRIAEKESNNV